MNAALRWRLARALADIEDAIARHGSHSSPALARLLDALVAAIAALDRPSPVLMRADIFEER